jgi:hypothetical protein
LEISVYDTSTKRGSNQAPFDKISKSGDSGHSGGILDTLTISNKSKRKRHDVRNK